MMRTSILVMGLVTAASAHAAVHVQSVALASTAKGWQVRVHASAKTPYTLHPLHEPERLLIDVPDAVLDVDARVRPTNDPHTPAIRYSQLTRNPNVVRIVVDLPDDAPAYREASSAPAMNIVLQVLGAGSSVSGRTVATAPPTKQRTAHRPTPKTQHPTPVVISARDLEERLHRERKGKERTEPSLPEPRVGRLPRHSRSTLASRAGFFQRTPVDALADGGDMALPPLPAAPDAPVAPAWNPDEAVALIENGDTPGPLKRRLIEVLRDPAIQTSRYVWGSETPGAFDCSGLALYIYDGLDVKLPRCSYQQCETGMAVEKDDLRAGDLVFFITHGTRVSHVGIYLGEGQFLHAANSQRNLQITALDAPYYTARYAGARRVYATDIASADTLRSGG